MNIEIIKKFVQDKSSIYRSVLSTTKDGKIVVNNFPLFLIVENDSLPSDLCVDASVFVSIVSKLENPTISIEKESVILQENNTVFKIPMLNSDNRMEKIATDTPVELDVNGIIDIMSYAKKFRTFYPEYANKVFIHKNKIFFTNNVVALFKYTSCEKSLSIPISYFVSSISNNIKNVMIDENSKSLILSIDDNATVIIPVDTTMTSMIDTIASSIEAIDISNLRPVPQELINFITNFSFIGTRVLFNIKNTSITVSIETEHVLSKLDIDNTISDEQNRNISFNIKEFSYLLRLAKQFKIKDRIAIFNLENSISFLAGSTI